MVNENGLASGMEDVETRVSAITEQLEVSSDVTKILYHYTTLEGLLGIIEKREIWCSDVLFTNDPSETVHARELVGMSLTGRLEAKSAQAVLKVLDDIERYTVSLSSNGDLLQQWRAYCQNGRGVAIGIPVSVFLQHPELIVGRVEYDLKKQKEMVDGVVDAYVESLAELEEWPAKTLVNMAINLFVLTSHFKTSAYSVEEEYRVHYTSPSSKTLGVPPSELRFRAGRTFLVPYVAVPLLGSREIVDPIPLEIIVGPCLEWETTATALSRLFARENLPKVNITRSNVQMRHL